jgi:predicted alpha/beta-fold hydrolase
VYAVGYSLGANALLKYLAEDGTDCPLSLAVAISPPLVLAQAATRMNRGLSRVYQQVLVRQMQKAILAKRARYPAMDLPSDVRQLRTFFDFDNHVTAPLNGFRDVHDYYEQASSRPVLHAIRRPTHIIFARDDPFFTPACIPTAEELSAQVVFELSDHGGHVGFIATGPRGGLRYWLDERIAALLNATRQSV